MILSLSWVTTVMWISIRLSVVLLFTPIQVIKLAPISVRLLLVFVLSLLVVNFLPNQPTSDTNYLLSGLAEGINGLILALSLYAAFAVVHIAGFLIDSATGLNALAIFNPTEHAHEPWTSRLLGMLASVYFFSLQGHIWLFKGLVYSFTIIPPGAQAVFANLQPVIKQFGFMFSMAFMLASPIIMALLGIDLFGAVLTRNMPQISPYFFMLPIKIALGFLFLALMLYAINPLINKLFTHCFQTWQEIML